MSPEVARRRTKGNRARVDLDFILGFSARFRWPASLHRRFGHDSAAAVEPGGRILEVLGGAVRGRCFAHVVLRPPRVDAVVDVNRIMRARSQSGVSRNYGIRRGLDESG